MSDESLEMTRRQALATLFGLGAAALLATCRKASAPMSSTFPQASRAVLAAVCERIFPGSTDAAVLEFFDRTFTHPAFTGVGKQFQQATTLLDRLARARYKRSFAACNAAAQDALLVALRQGEVQGRGFDGVLFYKRLVVLTMEGLLGDPKHGGNKGEVGWKLVGYSPCHFTPRRLKLLGDDHGGLPY